MVYLIIKVIIFSIAGYYVNSLLEKEIEKENEELQKKFNKHFEEKKVIEK